MADAGDLRAYMTARTAAAAGRPDVAAAAYATVMRDAPASPVVAIRAYREALAAGDEALALRAVAVLEAAGVAPADAPLIALGRAANQGDTRAASAAVARLAKGPLVVLAPALNGWIAFAEKRDPGPALAAAAKDPVAARFAAENRALLTIAAGQTPDGVAALSAQGDLRATADVRIAAAQLLFGQGEGGRARALLSDDADPSQVALRRGAPARPGLAFGVSRLLTRIATDLSGGTPTPLSVALTRAALAADPGYDRARIVLADALSRTNATASALAVLDGVSAKSPFADAALSQRIAVLSAAGRDADALSAAKTSADGDDAMPEDWQRYADMLLLADRAREAVPYYRRVIDHAGRDGAGLWAAWLQYGGALDQAGRWPEARDALEQAVARGPAEPMTLNYLGFARIERGEDVAGATRMLERAHAIDPMNSSIADSLGWAYHLTGDTARALPLIETAVAQQPTNAEIAEHLGDAYWTIGRRYEARYAWRAAALTAEPTEASRLNTKIAQGLSRGAIR